MPGRLAAGRLRHRINIDEPVFATDEASGAEELTDWQHVFENVPAEILFKGGSEYMAAAQVQDERRVEVTIRWRPGLEETQRVVWTPNLGKRRIFNVRAVLPGGASLQDSATLQCTELSEAEYRAIVEDDEEPPPPDLDPLFTLTVGKTSDDTQFGFVAYDEGVTGYPGAPFGAVLPTTVNGADIIYLSFSVFGSGFQLIFYATDAGAAPASDLFTTLQFTDDDDNEFTFERAEADTPDGIDFTFGPGDVRAWQWTRDPSTPAFPALTVGTDYVIRGV